VEQWTIPADAVDGKCRPWVVAIGQTGLEIASLPLPWRSGAERAVLDIQVDERITGRAMTSVALRNSGMDGLLLYLDQGRTSLVAPFLAALEEDEGAIGEVPNPLAACVAAYARLSTLPQERSLDWERRLKGLMEAYPTIPDCAVLYARTIMLRPSGGERPRELLSALSSAVQAGIPYFSTGLRLLRDMLLARSPWETRQREMLEKVAPVAARCDPTELMTVLRYPQFWG
jgi:hypothetical protein